jgi:hypothetical protein
MSRTTRSGRLASSSNKVSGSTIKDDSDEGDLWSAFEEADSTATPKKGCVSLQSMLLYRHLISLFYLLLRSVKAKAVGGALSDDDVYVEDFTTR